MTKKEMIKEFDKDIHGFLGKIEHLKKEVKQEQDKNEIVSDLLKDQAKELTTVSSRALKLDLELGDAKQELGELKISVIKLVRNLAGF